MTRRRRQQRRRRGRRNEELAWVVPREQSAVFARPQAILTQAASNTVDGVDAPPRPLARWLDWVVLTPACWGLLLMGGYVAVSGVRSLDMVAMVLALGALFQVGALAHRLTSGKGAWRPGRGARADHVAHDLLVQLLARCDTRDGAWADQLARLHHDQDGWCLQVALDANDASARVGFQLGAPRAELPDVLSVEVFAAGPHNPWLGVSWRDGAVPTIERDAETGRWRLRLVLEDRGGARRRYVGGDVGLRAQIDAQSEAWAEQAAMALRPLVRAPQQARFGASVSAWGVAPEPAVEALECPQRASAEVMRAVEGVSYDAEWVDAAWRRARWAVRGRRFSRAVALAPLLACMAVLDMSHGLAWAGLACCGGAVVWLHTYFEGMIDPSTRPPEQPRRPRVSPSRALAWDGRALALGEDTVDLTRPFACALARCEDAQGRVFVVVELIERSTDGVGAGERARVRFQVEVERSEAWDRLDRLEVHAPTVSSAAFDAWVWPLIRHQLALHETRGAPVVRDRARVEAAACARASVSVS